MKSNPIIIRKTQSPSGARGPRVAIPGIYPSTSQFGEQVVKFRVPSLDSFIGGGVPVGSVCLIIDEFPSKFGDMVLKSFIADGACHNHRIFIASDKVDPEELAKDLPSIKKTSPSESDSALGVDSESLKIAWRYGQSHQSSLNGIQNKSFNSDPGSQSFEFSKRSSAIDLGGKHLFFSKNCSGIGFTESDLLGDKILRELMESVKGLELTNAETINNVTRICISHCENIIFSRQFMLRLRAIVRHTNSCAVIVISDAGFFGSEFESGKESFLARIEHLADIVISLQSVVDQKRRDELGGIDGICHIKKVASNNTLKIFEPPKDIGISFKKRRLLFHELHLPPEGETTTQRETSSSSMKSKTAGLASSTTLHSQSQGSPLDF